MHGSLGSAALNQINRKIDDALAGVSTIRVELLHHCLQVVPTPRLVQVMRPMVRQEHVSPAADQPRRNHEPNPLPTTDPRDEWHSLEASGRSCRLQRLDAVEGVPERIHLDLQVVPRL